MLNEWQEFLDYTGPVTYTGNKSKDTSYMGRFTFKNILEFEGLPPLSTNLPAVSIAWSRVASV